MLADNAVNAEPPRAVMLSIAALAARDGVSRPAVSRKVKQLVADHGLYVERDGQGRVAGVNVAEYDHLRGRVDDPSKAQARRGKGRVPAGETYDDAIRQKTWIEAERSKMRLAQEKGELVLVSELQAAVAICGEAVVLSIGRFVFFAEDMAAAYERDGLHGLQTMVKAVIFKMRREVADALETCMRRAQGHGDDNRSSGDSP